MSEIVLRNLQRVRRINTPLLRRVVATVLDELAGAGEHELCIHLIAANEMARINQQYLQHEGSTDVITFDYSDDLEELLSPNEASLADAPMTLPLPPQRGEGRGEGPSLLGTSGKRTAEGQKLISTSSPRPSPPSFVRKRGGNLHGEIFICLDDAIAQARQFRTTWQSELVRYVVHGILHLLGHDDLKPAARRKMKTAENRIVRSVATRFPLSQLARRPKLRG